MYRYIYIPMYVLTIHSSVIINAKYCEVNEGAVERERKKVMCFIA